MRGIFRILIPVSSIETQLACTLGKPIRVSMRAFRKGGSGDD